MELEDQEKRVVTLTIHAAKALPVADRETHSSDPYVVFFADDLPLDGKKRPKVLGKTKTVKKVRESTR
jgi:hypothetical protein